MWELITASYSTCQDQYVTVALLLTSLSWYPLLTTKKKKPKCDLEEDQEEGKEEKKKKELG